MPSTTFGSATEAKTTSPFFNDFHNYIIVHEGLNGMTPSEACGVKIEENNKWITIIQNASYSATVDILLNSTRSQQIPFFLSHNPNTLPKCTQTGYFCKNPSTIPSPTTVRLWMKSPSPSLVIG